MPVSAGLGVAGLLPRQYPQAQGFTKGVARSPLPAQRGSQREEAREVARHPKDSPLYKELSGSLVSSAEGQANS